MARNSKRVQKIKEGIVFFKQLFRVELPENVRRVILGMGMFMVAIIVALSFFDAAGVAGAIFFQFAVFGIGKSVFILPFLFVLAGLIFIFSPIAEKKPVFFAICFLILGISGIITSIDLTQKEGGWLGFVFASPLIRFFGFWVTEIIFFGINAIGVAVLFYFLLPSLGEPLERPVMPSAETAKPTFLRKILAPKLRITKVFPEPEVKITTIAEPKLKEFRVETLKRAIGENVEFVPPPTDLLESDVGSPTAGDVKTSSMIIKKTLQNFGIQVEMAEVNIGPTVTQYTFKPAEGVKLSKITVLSNDLALSLAASSIRIEAPIPGKSLVGIEVPNKVRALVRLRNLVEHPNFQNALSNLTFILGRDTSGNPVFADLARMPHLLVAGATGTGKTVCLNSIILSLLYRNSPEILRFVLIDPKRVEFQIYNDLPHLLSPVILDAQKTVNALKWLVEEMERRFDLLSAEKARDITAFNDRVVKNGRSDIMPFIVLIIDELADLMAARGREVEAGVVRLAQMARATGVHLIVATQRPSVEVITGLIKANITSRITFQVASQVDSRTVFDMGGAEKLLGRGDMLFTSAENTKPKRIQAPYVSEKEIKRIVNHIRNRTDELKLQKPEISEFQQEGEKIAQGLQKSVEEGGDRLESFFGEDPLYEEAKRIIIEARKASASFLQRKLRIGYARAARLLDILEQKGVVGPADGAKPREVYIVEENQNANLKNQGSEF